MGTKIGAQLLRGRIGRDLMLGRGQSFAFHRVHALARYRTFRFIFHSRSLAESRNRLNLPRHAAAGK